MWGWRGIEVDSFSCLRRKGSRQATRTMKLLSVADLHYTLKQFGWLIANARGFDALLIGGDLLNLASAA